MATKDMANNEWEVKNDWDVRDRERERERWADEW